MNSMKHLTICDISLPALAQNRTEMPLCEKRALLRSFSAVGIDSVSLPHPKGNKEAKLSLKTLVASAKTLEFRIAAGVTEEEIAEAAECVKGAEKAVLQIVFPVSTVQMEYTYHLKPAKAIPFVTSLIAKAKETGYPVEFVAQDATRADSAFLLELCTEAVKAGAGIVSLSDDAELAMPEDFAELVTLVLPCGAERIEVSTSDALHLGVADALAAVKAGATGVKTVSVDGNGMKLEDFCRLFSKKQDVLPISSSVDFTAVYEKMHRSVSVSAQQIPEANAAQTVFTTETSLPALVQMLEALGYDLTPEDQGKVYNEAVRVASKKGKIGGRELDAVIANCAMQVPSTYHLESYVINCGNVISSTAQLCVTKNNEKFTAVCIGDGPIDAAFHTLEQILGHHYELEEFRIEAVTEGREALGSALVKLRSGGKLYSGSGLSTDIVGASIRAYLNAVNKIVFEEA